MGATDAWHCRGVQSILVFLFRSATLLAQSRGPVSQTLTAQDVAEFLRDAGLLSDVSPGAQRRIGTVGPLDTSAADALGWVSPRSVTKSPDAWRAFRGA